MKVTSRRPHSTREMLGETCKLQRRDLKVRVQLHHPQNKEEDREVWVRRNAQEAPDISFARGMLSLCGESVCFISSFSKWSSCHKGYYEKANFGVSASYFGMPQWVCSRYNESNGRTSIHTLKGC